MDKRKVWSPERRKAHSESLKASYQTEIGKKKKEKLSQYWAGFYASEKGKLEKEIKSKRFSRSNPSSDPKIKKKAAESQHRFWISPAGQKEKENIRRRLGGKSKKLSSTQKQSESMRRIWQDPARIKKYMEGHHASPNKPEALLHAYLSEDWEFTGGGSFSIGRKLPDFTNKKTKQVIEMFGDYWHGTERTGILNSEHEAEKIQYYKQHGWECLVIWEHELENSKCLFEKLVGFIQ